MAFNQKSFIDFSNDDIVESINNINQGLNENLEIADTPWYRGGAKLLNIRTLYIYLNQHNAQQIINPDFNDNNDFLIKLDNFISHEQERREQEFHDKQVRDDNEFFNNFDKNKYKQIDVLDELTRINSQNKF